jgi:Carboxypeptidase regulatory-like domain
VMAVVKSEAIGEITRCVGALNHATEFCVRRSFAALLICVIPSVLIAQTNVSGFVRDSLSGKPLAGAVIQLVPSATPWAAGRTVRSDSIGRYAVDTVAAGMYLIGFQHPRLDSLGLDAVSRTISIDRGIRILRADLALPSGRTFVTSLCGARTDSSGAIIGRVFNADDQATISAGQVVVRWTDLRVGTSGVRRVPVQVAAAVGTDGRYVACGVPTDAPLLVQARSRNADTTKAPGASGEIELSFASNVPLLHRDLLIASQETPANAPGAARVTPRQGTARIAGRVTASDGTPVNNARITIHGTDVAVTSDSTGAFRANGLPAGTRALEVMALGYAPIRSSVDLRPNRESAISLSVGAKVNTLTGVEVVGAPADRSGFTKRRAQGLGFFLDANTMERRGAQNVAQALTAAPTLRGNGFDTQNPSRPIISGRNNCTPSAYLDGQLLRDGLGGIDDVLTIRRVGGVEVYPSPMEAPAQFRGVGSCAVILVWTRSYVP